MADTNANAVTEVNLLSTGTLPIATGITAPIGIVLEQGGLSALVNDCGQNGNCNGSVGRLLRVTLARGIISSIVTTGFMVPRAVAIVSSDRALVAENGGNRLADVNLSNGAVTSKFTLTNPWGVAIESIESTGGTALVTEGNDSRLSRVDLTTGSSTVLAKLNRDYFDQVAPPGSIALEGIKGTALVVDNDRIARVTLGTAFTPKTIARGLTIPGFIAPVAIEPSGARVLYAHCPGTAPLCGRLMRVSISGGTPEVILTGLNTIGGIAMESDDSALITECGATPGECTANGCGSSPEHPAAISERGWQHESS